MRFSIVIGLLLTIAALVFAFQNNSEITVSFFSTSITGSVALLIIASLIVGFIIGMVVFAPSAFFAQWKIAKLEKQNKKLQEEADQGDIQYESEGLGAAGEKHIDIQ